MTNEECRTALKRIAGYMCAKKDLEALTYAMDVLEHISSELEKNSKKLENNIGELDCISRKRAIERLKLNLPISDGADNSRDRHRYMQSLADIQAIRELPSVTPQEPILDKLRVEMKPYTDPKGFIVIGENRFNMILDRCKLAQVKPELNPN